MNKMLYKHRFEIFLTIQLAILFGSLIFPNDFFEQLLTPILYMLNILAGMIMISKQKKTTWFFFLLFLVVLIFFGNSIFSKRQEVNDYLLYRLGVYFIFNIIVTWNIIKQVWQEKEVDSKMILGLISGYISLGFLGFFLFMSIELSYDNAFTFSLLEGGQNFEFDSDNILYYSFITLLTIGYGEITPIIPIAQKAAVLVGLMGQFYMVIITGVVIEKYIFKSRKNE
jgi:hypothetical protein